MGIVKSKFRYVEQNGYSSFSIDILRRILSKNVQGQVYRSEQNDCKGKGTQADWWGREIPVGDTLIGGGQKMKLTLKFFP